MHPQGMPPYGQGRPPRSPAGPQNGGPQGGSQPAGSQSGNAQGGNTQNNGPQAGGPNPGGPNPSGPQPGGPQFGPYAGPPAGPYAGPPTGPHGAPRPGGDQPGKADRQPGGPGGPGGQPQRPQREPIRPGEQPKRPPLSLKTRWARGLALGGGTCTLFALLFGYRSFPAWLVGAAVGLVLAIAGLWIGAFAQREAANSGQKAPEAIVAIVWCVISSVLSLFIIAVSLTMYPQLKQYAQCERTSNTVTEQHACVEQFKKSWPFDQSAAGGSAVR